jgi:hypothetical protein
MRYDAIVSLVFATERTDEDRYDIWEIHTPFEADRPKTALLDAITLSKSFEDWKELVIPRSRFYTGSGRFTGNRV